MTARSTCGGSCDAASLTVLSANGSAGRVSRARRNPLEAHDVPREPAVLGNRLEAAALHGRHHLARWMREGAVGLAGQAVHRVLTVNQPLVPRLRRVAVDEETLRVVGGGAQQPVDVGVAADDAVQHHHVGRVHRLRIGREVQDAPVDAVGHARLAGQCSSLSS